MTRSRAEILEDLASVNSALEDMQYSDARYAYRDFDELERQKRELCHELDSLELKIVPTPAVTR